MPIELAERPVSVIDAQISNRLENSFGKELLENEFNPDKTPVILKPLLPDPNREHYYSDGQRALYQKLEEDFEYYSKTRDLEFDTERTNILQGVVDKMTVGTDIQTRVVIMNKGGVQAFVTPDGTVFVSQSLLNEASSLDEVAGVLGHEVGHLIHKTSVREIQARDAVTRFAIGWAHEEACDYEGRKLAEKAGYNSMALASVVERIQGMERGLEHQSGLTRASIIIGSHAVLDSTTAHLDLTSIPENLHKEFRNTNLEIAQELIKTAEVADIRGILENLHPQDLEDIYLKLWSGRKSGDINYERLKVLNDLIIERTMQAGYSQADAKLLLLSHPSLSVFYEIEDTYLINTQESFKEVVNRLREFESGQMRRDLHKLIFSTNLSISSSSPSEAILTLLRLHLYDLDKSIKKEGIPVTQESLLDTLDKIGGIYFSKNDNMKGKDIAGVLTKYIDEAFIKPSIQNKTDNLEGLRNFLVLLKERGIKFDSSEFIKAFYTIPRYRTGTELESKNQLVLKIYSEVFEVDISEGFDFKDIDQFFENFQPNSQYENNEQSVVLLIGFIRKIQNHFYDFGIEDAERVKFLDYINEKVNGLSFQTRINLLQFFEEGNQGGTDWSRNQPTEKESIVNQAIQKFSMKLIFGMTIFSRDGEEFYQYISQNLTELETAMQQSGITPQKLSKVQLINLCQGLLQAGDYNDQLLLYGTFRPYNVGKGRGGVDDILSIKDYDRLFKLPFIKELAEREEEIDATDIKGLLEYTDQYLKRLNFYFAESSSPDYSLYSDQALSLVIGRPIARRFNQIAEGGIPVQEFDNLFSFVYRYFPAGVQKDDILRAINKKYLESKEVNFEQKMTYLLGTLDRVGYEGVKIVVEQIKDINTYRSFRRRMGNRLEKYLEGGETLINVATADVVSTALVGQFEKLFETTKDGFEDQQTVSTKLAWVWLDFLFKDYRAKERGVYSKDEGKFILSQTNRAVFRSLADIFTQLRNFSDLQRYVISHKALMEKGGALTSEENRQKLADVLVSALRLPKGFVSEVLTAGVKEGDAKYIGFPASKMISTLIFRALNISSIDMESLRFRETWSSDYRNKVKIEDEIYANLDLPRILGSGTRDIVLFGANTRKDPEARLAKLATESDELYYETVARLNTLLGIEPQVENGVAKKENGINPGYEAVIKGVEFSGALGIRALQLASQFHTFSPEVNRRLSETLDSNPGMERLTFWENLNMLTVDNPENLELEDFLQRVRLGKKLGGGSLQTTHAATLVTDAGERAVVIKRRNPAVVGLLQGFYDTSISVLEKVIQKGDVKSREYAKNGIILLDLAKGWCIADINDTTYVEYDDQFRQTIARFNQALGKQAVSAPERILTQMAVKSEDEASGRTVNQILNDESVGRETKKQLVEMLGRFFTYQMRGNSFVEDNGKKYFLIHSDPHVGNYMADVESSGPIQMSVIDRSMYLKLSEKEVKVLGKLIDGSMPNDFIYSFIDLVLDGNKDINRMERLKITGRVFKNVAQEFANQVVQGRVNKLSLLGILLKDLSSYGKDIPWKVRLMIRNIAAMQELGRRYGVDIGQIYKQAV